MSKRRLINVLGAAVVAAGLTLGGASVASAGTATFYDNINYGTQIYAATSANSMGSANDVASSFTHSGTGYYYEDINRIGTNVTLIGSYNDLRAVSSNLRFGLTWSDRISSFR